MSISRKVINFFFVFTILVSLPGCDFKENITPLVISGPGTPDNTVELWGETV